MYNTEDEYTDAFYVTISMTMLFLGAPMAHLGFGSHGRRLGWGSHLTEVMRYTGCFMYQMLAGLIVARVLNPWIKVMVTYDDECNAPQYHRSLLCHSRSKLTGLNKHATPLESRGAFGPMVIN